MDTLVWLNNRQIGVPDTVRHALRNLPDESVIFRTNPDACTKRMCWQIEITAPKGALLKIKSSRMIAPAHPPRWAAYSIWSAAYDTLRTWAEVLSWQSDDSKKIECRILESEDEFGDVIQVVGDAEPTLAELADMQREARQHADSDGP